MLALGLSIFSHFDWRYSYRIEKRFIGFTELDLPLIQTLDCLGNIRDSEIEERFRVYNGEDDLGNIY